MVAIPTRKFSTHILTYKDWPGIGHLVAMVTTVIYVTMDIHSIPLHSEIHSENVARQLQAAKMGFFRMKLWDLYVEDLT